jgi:elongator complex protein 3
MLRLGGTKVEVGVQTTYEEINRAMHRGHGTEASTSANRRLRDAGFKVGFHMMPGQPGMSKSMCREDFRRLFESEHWRPDYLKIYPTLVVEGTAVYDAWHEGAFEPLTNEEATELIADVKPEIPRYTRLQRVQRDIPADFIEGGVWKSNLRQLARKRLAARGESCSCIRCREVGHNDATPENPTMETASYAVAGGTEHFLSIEDRDRDLLVAFCRVRFPSEVLRRELEDAAVVRELHVYGGEVGVGAGGTDADGVAAESHQHQGHGRRLLRRAEEIAADAGYERLAVLSGIGVRPYYREKLDYRQDGPYVTKRL